MSSLSVSLMADSMTRAGDRLCTVLTRGALEHELGGLGRLGWTVTRPGADLAVITGGDPQRWPGEIGARLDALVGWPNRVGADGLHAPFLTDAERHGLDIAVRAALAAARAATGGAPADQRADLARYGRLAGGPAADRQALHHVALPSDHWVFGQHTARTGEPVPAGRYRGWLSWGELLDWRGKGRPLGDPSR